MNYRLHRNHQKASGRTYWQLVWEDNSGATLKKSLGACSKREAQVKMQNFIASHAATPALKGITKSPRLHTWLDRYLKIRESDLRRATMDIHRQCVRQLKEFFSHDPRIEQIQRPAATDWRLWLAEKGGANGRPLGEATVCRQAKTAKVIMRHAMTEGLIGVNPFEHLKVTPPVKDQFSRRFVKREELAKVILRQPEIEPLLMLCYCAGLRFSEALHLRYGDVYPRKRKLIVRPREGVETSKQRGREVLVTQELFDWGDEWDHRREQLIKALDPTNPYVAVVENFQQEPIASLTVCGIIESGRHNLPQRLLRKACEAANVEPFTFNDLRRTRDTLWHQEFPSHVVCAWMGHSEAVARKHYLSVPESYYSRDSSSPSDAEDTMRHHKDDTPQWNESTCDTTDGLIRGSGNGPYWTYPAYRSPIGPIRVTRCGGAK